MSLSRALVFLAALVLLPLNSAVAQSVSRDQASRETQIEGLRLLEQTGGVNIGYVEKDTTPGNGKYLCGGMSSGDAKSGSGVVARALAKLPNSVLARLQLKYVIVCSRTLASGQRIGGIPVPPLSLLMLDLGERGDGSERIVLHELYHLIEYRFGVFNDAEWQRRFGEGYAGTYAAEMNRSGIGTGKRGFANAYSETFPHEERAELFALLVLEPGEIAVYLNKSQDHILRKKILYVIEKCGHMLGWAPPTP